MIDRDMRDIFAAHILGGVTMTREMCTTQSIYDRAELMMQERARRDNAPTSIYRPLVDANAKPEPYELAYRAAFDIEQRYIQTAAVSLTKVEMTAETIRQHLGIEMPSVPKAMPVVLNEWLGQRQQPRVCKRCGATPKMLTYIDDELFCQDCATIKSGFDKTPKSHP